MRENLIAFDKMPEGINCLTRILPDMRKAAKRKTSHRLSCEKAISFKDSPRLLFWGLK